MMVLVVSGRASDHSLRDIPFLKPFSWLPQLASSMLDPQGSPLIGFD